ncbi:malate dehydrogenase [Halteromyces radiatus]|uniref:malate dehydrogenase n=1 Tax=Halteromyces radiatus TaxID=101107 RepID=UPI0022204E81|nr:malate dehydrogenase [Halteromyces radiatus]KAI8093886.1 malate dehydrogenase [Halteromyces radiatus]
MSDHPLPKKIFSYSDQPGNSSIVQTTLLGQELLDRPLLNKGSAFTQEERAIFSLSCLLPYEVDTLEQQVQRVSEQYDSIDTNLGKNTFLQSIHDQNEVLFFRFVLDHLVKVLPVIYTPTEGEYIEKYSHLFRRPRGVYLNYPEKERIQQMLIEGILQQSLAADDVDLVVVTDSEEILGIGDQGVGGCGISVAKLVLYTVMAGIHPGRVLAVVLDVGTDNQTLLDDPLYLGWKHKRIRGQAYDDFVDFFVECVRGKFPNAFLHWEDFGLSNARRLLDTYRPKMATFNDDVQGTGAITLALLLAALQLQNVSLSNQRLAIFGAGSAGIGIADQVRRYLVQKEGLSENEALKRIWCIDKQGLLMEHDKEVSKVQQTYVKNKGDIQSWTMESEQPQILDVIKNVQPTILIGTSTCSGAFTEKLIKSMASYCDIPIVFPLSNPTQLTEATPNDIIHWTNGKAIVATGSPFEDVEYNNRIYEVTECNNAFIYPGIGLGCIVAKAKHCTDDMIFAAANAICHCSPAFQSKDLTKSLLPDIKDIRLVSKKVAMAVAKEAMESGESRRDDIKTMDALEKMVDDYMWYPQYPSYTYISSL